MIIHEYETFNLSLRANQIGIASIWFLWLRNQIIWLLYFVWVENACAHSSEFVMFARVRQVNIYYSQIFVFGVKPQSFFRRPKRKRPKKTKTKKDEDQRCRHLYRAYAAAHAFILFSSKTKRACWAYQQLPVWVQSTSANANWQSTLSFDLLCCKILCTFGCLINQLGVG